MIDDRAERTALLALVATCALTIAKLVAWAATSSLAVLSQALDSAMDIVALGLVFVAVRVSGRPADRSHHFGHAKAENLIAFAQTLFLGVVVVAVALEALGRLSGPRPDVDTPGYAFALLAASAAIDTLRARSLTAASRAARSDALRAGALNLSTDVGTALVALISLALVRAGLQRADAVGGLVVAAAVAVATFRLGRRSVDVLMDRAPTASLDAIEDAARAAPGVAETRRVRVRDSGKQLFADVTVAARRTATLERAHDISEAVEREIQRVAPGADVVVHVEPSTEAEGIVERVQAAASRIDGVHEVHNVQVRAFDERDRGEALHVTFHAKARAGITLEQAHDLSERIEEAVKKELGARVRVDTHLEPLEPAALGHDVTSARQDVVSAVRALALQQRDVVDCHEIVVTEAEDKLSVTTHVRARRDLPLASIHGASERIEKAIHQALPEVGSVVIHFEPA